MTQAVAHLLEEAEKLSTAERAELVDHLMASVVYETPDDVAASQLAEVRRRIEEVDSGAVELIPADQVFAKVQELLAEAKARGRWA